MNPFEMFGLHPELEQAVTELGYSEPTPIQMGAIPALLEGFDVLGQAQTGTGKTAAFGLPLLQKLDKSARGVQALVLTPTRELAIQVSEALSSYGQHLKIRVLPIYGGQSYTRQINALNRGVQVVVGTPGRMLDLINQKSLDLSGVRYLVLDEADEMLKMGFIDDVEAILSEIPAERQTALFSATMPVQIRRLAERYMREPQEVTIQRAQMTVEGTEQRYYLLQESSKVAALARLLETEELTSALVFARTKAGVAELAETLLMRGFMAEAIHGDLTQEAREAALRRFRNGQMTILVATDVVARGIDIQDVSHVINFDMPYDPEDYVHRIGRTGRAGRSGIAITLVTPRERGRLRFFENFTRQSITRGTLPGIEDVQARRDERFMTALEGVMNESDLRNEKTLVAQLEALGCDINEVAAAAIRLARANELQRPVEDVREVSDYQDRGPRRDSRGSYGPRNDQRPSDRGGDRPRGPRREAEAGMVRLLLNIGRDEGARPADIVGSIASEANIPGKAIGAIDILPHQTFVDVRAEHAPQVLKQSGRVYVRGHQVTISQGQGGGGSNPRGPRTERFDKRSSKKSGDYAV
jgi:ATP-dependent RNA helicase DeaD